jgi:two-component system nitrogen regulation sensor histidine kinase NtrY
MKLKTKYILFLVILHLICLVMSYFIFEENKLIFLVTEVFIIISILISLSLYKQLISPLTYLKQGISAIKDKDFNVKFVATGKKEVDELVDVYNRMIDELRTERTKQQEQHFFLEKLIQTSPTGIIILDYDKQIKQINPKATEILADNPNLLENQLHAMKTGSSKMLRINGLHTYKIQKSRFIDRGFERIFIMMEEVTARNICCRKECVQQSDQDDGARSKQYGWACKFNYQYRIGSARPVVKPSGLSLKKCNESCCRPEPEPEYFYAQLCRSG